jgi:hypothetical protein
VVSDYLAESDAVTASPNHHTMAMRREGGP